MSLIWRSILRLPKVSPRYPSTNISIKTLKVYAAVPTPVRISTIVNTFSPGLKVCTSPKPTVVTVMTVWNTESSTP